MGKSKIPWTDDVWNPITGCTRCSPACGNCYAAVMTRRQQAMGNSKYAKGFDTVVFHESELYKPGQFGHGKRKRIFVCSMSDIFHPHVSGQDVYKVFKVMNQTPHHDFLVLTKRPERAMNLPDIQWTDNIWLGVTVCNQDEANKKIPLLLNIPAAKHFVSIEPMLGPIDLCEVNDVIGFSGKGTIGSIDWVIVGGETGHKARPMHPNWVRLLRDQCKDMGTAFFFKGWGKYVTLEKGTDYDDLPRMMQSFFVSDAVDFNEKWSDCLLVLKKIKGSLHGPVPKGTLNWREIPKDTPTYETEFAVPANKKLIGHMLDGREWNEVPE